MLTGSFLHKMGESIIQLLLKVLGTFAIRQSKWRGSREEKYVSGLYFSYGGKSFCFMFVCFFHNKIKQNIY